MKNGKAKAFPFSLSVHFVSQSQVVRNHCDKFRVCGLAAVVLDRVSEVGIESIYVASVPRDFNCVTDRTLDA